MEVTCFHVIAVRKILNRRQSGKERGERDWKENVLPLFYCAVGSYSIQRIRPFSPGLRKGLSNDEDSLLFAINGWRSN